VVVGGRGVLAGGTKTKNRPRLMPINMRFGKKRAMVCGFPWCRQEDAATGEAPTRVRRTMVNHVDVPAQVHEPLLSLKM
jgi:hypothetical protein